jgi:hypothetical protein
MQRVKRNVDARPVETVSEYSTDGELRKRVAQVLVKGFTASRGYSYESSRETKAKSKSKSKHRLFRGGCRLGCYGIWKLQCLSLKRELAAERFFQERGSQKEVQKQKDMTADRPDYRPRLACEKKEDREDGEGRVQEVKAEGSHNRSGRIDRTGRFLRTLRARGASGYSPWRIEFPNGWLGCLSTEPFTPS